MSGLTGGGVKEPNIILRFFMIIFLGLLGFGVALSWKSSYILASEYQDMPISKKQLEIKKKNLAKQQEILLKQQEH